MKGRRMRAPIAIREHAAGLVEDLISDPEITDQRLVEKLIDLATNVRKIPLSENA